MQKAFSKRIKALLCKLGLHKLLSPRINEIDCSIHLTSQILSKFKQYIPHNSSAIDFKSLSIILNDISINNRRSVIEFGSGFSTLVIAKFIQLNNVECDFISIEHDEDWLNHVNKLLTTEGIEGNVTLQHMPLENDWYNLNFINEIINRSHRIDSLIVDGPPADKAGKEYSRNPAMLKLNDYLADNCFILLHDTDRPAENKIVKNWERTYQVKFKNTGKSSYCIKGKAYNIV